jgi:hypothetical protein
LRILQSMTEESRCERTARLLAHRLDEICASLDRAGAPMREAGRRLELATVATQHAVALRLLSDERAEAIWDDAAARHPALRGACGRYASYR